DWQMPLTQAPLEQVLLVQQAAPRPHEPALFLPHPHSASITIIQTRIRASLMLLKVGRLRFHHLIILQKNRIPDGKRLPWSPCAYTSSTAPTSFSALTSASVPIAGRRAARRPRRPSGWSPRSSTCSPTSRSRSPTWRWRSTIPFDRFATISLTA